jgi:hypothetical protein
MPNQDFCEKKSKRRRTLRQVHVKLYRHGSETFEFRAEVLNDRVK